MRALILLLSGALLAPAQMALFTAEPERAVGGYFDMGGVAAGDTVETRFRLKNTGSVARPVSELSVAGTGFSITAAPSLPRVVPPGEWFDFTVRFEAAAAGTYSASLRADHASAILLAAATPAHEVAVEENGGWRVLVSGAVVDFGAVERGAVAQRRFAVSHRSGAAPVELAVSPGAFALEPGAPQEAAPVPGQPVIVTVLFNPAATGVVEAVLAVGARQFRLRAEAVEPRLPRPELLVELADAQSARQGRLLVRLVEPSRTRAAGVVRLAFEPAAGLGPDPGVVFVSGGREAAFSVEEGDSAVRFGARTYIEFQTGSTAGTLVFTLEAGGYEERRTVTVAPAPVGIAQARAVRTASSVEVEIGAFDNSRGISQVTFTFFTPAGKAVEPGPLRVNVRDAFEHYFADSLSGGTFLLRAVFPVSGGAERIGSVEAELLSPVGTSSTGTVIVRLSGGG